MATPKYPSNLTEFMQMFEPENVAKMFDPKSMMETFGASFEGMDPAGAMATAKDQFDAMVKSNEATAATYRELMSKQTQIFQDLTSEAAKQMQSNDPAEASAQYQASVKRALELMTELSNATRDANAKALETVQAQVEQAMKDLTPKS